MGRKAEHEKEVLREFLECLYGAELKPLSIVSKKPPEPDLLVKFPKKEEYYEIARILDKYLMKLRFKAMRIAPKLVKVNTSKVGLAERDVLKSKLKKQYKTDSKDMNLLLYYDKGIYFHGFPPFNPTILYNDQISPLLEGGSQFKNIYIYDRIDNQVLWKY
ncbi:MAG: hypothetical protein MUO72_20550 [Bacteroidales bacterium]|nr:hypothetical protein [Bacteroidales bacterium]